MSRFFLFIGVMFTVAAGALDLPEVAVNSGDVRYIFGADNGLTRVETIDSGEILIDLGSQPGWFLLTYMHQHSPAGQGGRSQADYVYPRFGENSDCIGRWVFSDPGCTTIKYRYELVRPNYCSGDDQCTQVDLFFKVRQTMPMNGIAVHIDVQNAAPDFPPYDLTRLMEIHCPFLRLPKIGSVARDDVLTLGNYLLRDPIHELSRALEPGAPDDGGAAEGVYPNGFYVSAYYDRGEHPGRGFYTALYNTPRKASRVQWGKHEGDFAQWPYLGSPENWPSEQYREYLVWDVVRYTEDIDVQQNDYPYDPTFCAFLSFQSEGLDWYNAACRYRETIMAIDDATPCDDCPDQLLDFAGRDGDINLWPDDTIRTRSSIPDWIRYCPLMLYISPQATQSDFNVFSDPPPTPIPGMPESESYILDRIRAYQDALNGLLEIYPGHNDILAATWMYEWAKDPREGYIDGYWNYPEWVGGNIPVDSDPGSAFQNEDWKTRFIRDGFDGLMDALHAGEYGMVRYMAHNGGYFIDNFKENKFQGNPKWDDEGEHRWLSWAYNGFKRPELREWVSGKEVNWIWKNQTLDVPVRKGAVWQMNVADKDAMDFTCGLSVPDTGLEAGAIDSLIRDGSQYLGADGLYCAFGGSLPFRPCYEGFHSLGNHYIEQTDFDGNKIPPGGGNSMFFAERKLYRDLQAAEPDKAVFCENVGECFMDLIDLAQISLWPVQGFAEMDPGQAVNTSRRMIINTAPDLPLPVEHIPMIQAIAHQYVIIQDGLNAFPPDQYWHTEYPYFPERNGVKWSFYGGANPGTAAEKWLAYRADLAYSFVFGTRTLVFDVDVAVDSQGQDLPPGSDDPSFCVDLLSEVDAQDSVDYLKNVLAAYHQTGWPDDQDKLANALFFGEMLPPPVLTWTFKPPLFDRNIKYDLTAGMTLESMDVTLQSPSVLVSLWRVNPDAVQHDQNDRAVLVFSNFTQKTYNLETEAVDLTQWLFPDAGESYFWYVYSDPQNTRGEKELHPIANPASWICSLTVDPLQCAAIGICVTEPPPASSRQIHALNPSVILPIRR